MKIKTSELKKDKKLTEINNTMLESINFFNVKEKKKDIIEKKFDPIVKPKIALQSKKIELENELEKLKKEVKRLKKEKNKRKKKIKELDYDLKLKKDKSKNLRNKKILSHYRPHSFKIKREDYNSLCKKVDIIEKKELSKKGNWHKFLNKVDFLGFFKCCDAPNNIDIKIL